MRSILSKLHVVGNLRSDDAELLIETYRKHRKEPLVYVDNGYGDELLKGKVEVSFSLSESEHAQVSSIFSKDFHLKKLLEVVVESRNTISNKLANFHFIVFFTVTQFTGLLLLTQKLTSYANIHIFFLDFVVLLGVSYV